MAPSRGVPDEAELARFRTAQRLAYACTEAIAAELTEGVTEREAARRMHRWLRDHGVNDWFHEPFAWFGERTAFRNFSGLHPAFLPSGKKLLPGMPYILDCAPVLDGAVADVGYSGALGRNDKLERLMDDLAEHRALILSLVKARRSMADVSRAVDALCVRQGLEPRHKAYPYAVLAHRVQTLAPHGLSLRLFRFGTRALRALSADVRAGLREGWSPLWSSHRRSEHHPVEGLWAVEPHLGFRDVGAKFEELLVIARDDAYWLDDEPPHVRRWRARGADNVASATTTAEVMP